MTERLIRHNKDIPAATKQQQRDIRRIMLWPEDKAFPRCPSKNKKFMREHEEAGDFSHSKRDHLCDECRCKQRAGQGTKGDFYGLGVETGHLGVGYCSYHDINKPTAAVLKFADSQLRRIQQVGDLQMDSESHVKIIKEDARMAKMSLQAREDMELVVDTLTEFRRDLDGEKREDDEAVPVLKDILFRMNNMPNVDDDALKVFRKEVSDALLKKEFLTEMTKGGPVEMTDATKIKLKLDVAKTLSKIKLNHFKLDSNSYIHYDELKIRIPRMLNLAGNLFEKLKEMVINKEENAVQRITEEWVMGLHDVWSDAKTGVHD